MNNCIRYEIYLEEPLKMGTQGSQSNTESLTYIAGSTLRGAIIGKFAEMFCKDVTQELDKSEYAGILFKNTMFSDAYITAGNVAQMPVPFVYYADKHAVREAQKKAEESKEETFAVHSCAGISEKPAEGEQRIDIGKYCSLDDTVLRSVSVSRDANLHIALASEEAESKMFRYEAIAKGQTFLGIIQCDSEEAAEKYREVLEQNEIVYLGGSKGSGYGRCRIFNVEQKSFAEVLQEYQWKRTQKDNTLIIYALSNLCLVDEWGRVTGQIAPEFLEARLGITDVKLEQSFLSTFRTAGFNHKWRARQVQQTAVKAGSVYVYSYKGTLDENAVNKLEECGVGLRKNEGFGKILVNPMLNQTQRQSVSDAELQQAEVTLTDADKVFLREIAAQINSSRQEAVIQREALAIAEKSTNVLNEFSLTQLSRLYLELQSMFALNVENLDEAEAKNRITHIYEKKIKTKTKDAYDQALLTLKHSKYMKDVLKELVDDSVLVSDWNENVANTCAVSLTGEKWEGGCSNFVLKGRVLLTILYKLMRKEGAKE